MSLYIKNGKFYEQQSDKIVNIELGNQEQIDTIKKYEKFKDEGKLLSNLSSDITIIFKFQCLCGCHLDIKIDGETEFIDKIGNVEAIILTPTDKTSKCYRCGQMYCVEEKSKGLSLVMLDDKRKKEM